MCVNSTMTCCKVQTNSKGVAGASSRRESGAVYWIFYRPVLLCSGPRCFKSAGFTINPTLLPKKEARTDTRTDCSEAVTAVKATRELFRLKRCFLDQPSQRPDLT